jgi:signal transduction histidine kinase
VPETEAGKRSSRKPKAAEGAKSDDLASMLESLLDASQRSADQMSELLERSERLHSEIEQRGADLDRRLHDRRGTDLDRRLDDRRAADADQRMEEARALAAAAEQAKSCFLSAMSRELRTPVDSLARMIELLKQTDLDDQQRRYLQTASHSVCALLGLLESILRVSDVDAGIADLRSTDFDLRRVLEETVELLAPAARKKGLLLSCQVQPEVPTLLRGEPGRLQQIVLFAVRRAIQLAAHGEIATDASVAQSGEKTTTIRFTIDHGDTEVSPDELGRAFAPNAHLEGPCGPEGGRGLGLTIAKRIVENMGGRIGAESADHRGYTIWFTLPLDNYRQAADDRRAHGRLPQELLQCSLGPVLDLSMGGMRIQCSKALRGRLEVELHDIEGPVKIQAQVMWTRRLRFRKYEVGLLFPHVAPDVAKELTRVSLNHRLRRLLGIT